MIEVEVKLPVDSLERIETALSNMGFVYKERITQEDRYYDNGDGMIRGSGQALRIRHILGQSQVITFKGRKLDSVSMTRKELETSVGDMDVMHEILESLGFAVVPPVVKKIRKEYTLTRKYEMHACLDQVEGLGSFLELEIMAEEPERLQALAVIENILSELGYGIGDTTTNSYLSMLQGVED